MNNQILYTGSLFIGFILIMTLSEVLHKRFGVNSEFTRKIAHIVGTLVCLCCIFIIESHWYILCLEFSVFLILFIGKYKDSFKSIDSVERKTGGSYLLPIAIYLVFLISSKLHNNLIFVLPILILGISDPLAGIFGVRYKDYTRKIVINTYVFEKTVLGSGVFFVSTLIISLATLYLFDYSLFKVIYISLIIACVNTFVEIVSIKGVDNVTVPLITILLLYSFI